MSESKNNIRLRDTVEGLELHISKIGIVDNETAKKTLSEDASQLKEFKKETSAGTEAENITLASNYKLEPSEFKQMLDKAPKGLVTDEPLPLKPYTVSKEYD
ncbi:hypothetical protein [Halalkalibacterium ligniniphilum]|uniref:hypothetical protein n=1 Tax=Halalkalibacterium ligniniphilum TaxID=1134413 RepID=UPI00034C27D9|nr:hypothetical protein [Halalkalibacterium ligniniphilum]